MAAKSVSSQDRVAHYHYYCYCYYSLRSIRKKRVKMK